MEAMVGRAERIGCGGCADNCQAMVEMHHEGIAEVKVDPVPDRAVWAGLILLAQPIKRIG